MTIKGIYLDNSVAARPSDTAVSSMLPFLSERWSVPDVPHQKGASLLPAIKEALDKISLLIGAGAGDIFVFTSSGAEAVCQVFNSCFQDITAMTGKNHYVVGKNDEAPAIMAAGRLEAYNGVVSFAKVNSDGVVTADAVADAMTPRTALVSLSWANGLLGTVNPVEEIAAVCKERGVAIHLDASHLLGKHYYDLDLIDPHYITFSGECFHSPAGSGGLVVRNGIGCTPLIVGGLQQGGFRAGNYSVAALVALGTAAEEAAESRDFLCTETARLRNLFEKNVAAACPQAQPLFGNCERVPGVSVIAFPGIANEALLYALNREGLYASIGGGGFQQVAAQLDHCGFPKEISSSSISFSLSRETSEADVVQAALVIGDAVKKLSALSLKGVNDGI